MALFIGAEEIAQVAVRAPAVPRPSLHIIHPPTSAQLQALNWPFSERVNNSIKGTRLNPLGLSGRSITGGASLMLFCSDPDMTSLGGKE